jgi:hypothetical protein
MLSFFRLLINRKDPHRKTSLNLRFNTVIKYNFFYMYLKVSICN